LWKSLLGAAGFYVAIKRKDVVIHSFERRVNPRAQAHAAVQAFDFEGGFWCNSGFPGASSGVHFNTQTAQRRGRQPSVAAGSIMKRTYQASKTRRARTHGFLVRMKTRGGRAVINARRAKGRKRLAV